MPSWLSFLIRWAWERDGRVLGILHGLQKIPLFSSRQVGQLHSGIEGDFLLVHQVQQLRDEVGEADEALDVAIAAIAHVFGRMIRSRDVVVSQLGHILLEAPSNCPADS